MARTSTASSTEVLAGLVDRVTFHNPDNGFCVLRVKARGQRDQITLLGHAAIGRFPEPDRTGLPAILRRNGAATGSPGARALHSQRAGLGVLLSLSPRLTRHGRGPGARRNGSGVAAERHLG